jgi:glutamate-5-semialdehyde dehydrogenase
MAEKAMQETESTQDVVKQVEAIGKRAKLAAFTMATASTESKNTALRSAANSIRTNKDAIQAANNIDVEAAKIKGISGSFLDRLILNDDRIEGMAQGLASIADLQDPVGKELANWSRKENGLNIARVAVPLGVIGVIYESRPNVTADAGALCLKSGNCAILRGGSESIHSSKAIMACLQEGLRAGNLPEDAVQIIPTTDRAAVGTMLTLTDYIDVIIPRGGKSLIQRIIDESKIPTFQHLDGNCHSYVHSGADIDKAIAIIVNAKTRRTGVCGATESIVIDESVANTVLPKLTDALSDKDCELRGCSNAQSIDSRIKAATDEDFATEYLDSIASVKIVKDLDEAIGFISKYSSGHTDCIITEDADAANQFLNQIDSAIVMLNTSTQFADGGEFGMGAEIGIATGRMHARGPVGLDQLCTFKYQVRSNGSTRP